jgi:hypothetical protein
MSSLACSAGQDAATAPIKIDKPAKPKDPKPEGGEFTITVDGNAVDKVNMQGGPCNHGEENIPRLVWFPLTGNQKSAEVCVTVNNVVPDEIRVGAKSAEECVSTDVTATCQVCVQPCPDGSDP